MEAETPAPRRRVDEIAEWAITLAALAVMVTAHFATSGWPRDAALFPSLVSGFAAALLTLKLVAMVVRRLLAGPLRATVFGRGRGKALPSDTALTEAADAGVFATTPLRTWLETLIWLAVFFALLVVGGILPTLAIFGIAYLMIVAKRSIWFALIYVAVLIGAVQLLFVKLLSLRLPQGMLAF